LCARELKSTQLSWVLTNLLKIYLSNFIARRSTNSFVRARKWRPAFMKCQLCCALPNVVNDWRVNALCLYFNLFVLLDISCSLWIVLLPRAFRLPVGSLQKGLQSDSITKFAYRRANRLGNSYN